MIRQVVGPEVIVERSQRLTEQNIWFFIESINQQLRKNPINQDGSINVMTPHLIEESFLHRLIDMYLEAGWSEITYTFVHSTDNDPDWTKAVFKP